MTTANHIAIRSRKVKKILRLKARRDTLQARLDRRLQALEPLRRTIQTLNDELVALSLTLTGGQSAELQRAHRPPPAERANMRDPATSR